MAGEKQRDVDYERLRAFHVFFNSCGESTGKMSKSLRSALQAIVIVRAGDEVHCSGVMQAEAKFALLTEKIQAHKAPLITELEHCAQELGGQLLDYVRDAINYSNTKKMAFSLAATQNSWKRYQALVAILRNHVLPFWKRLRPGTLPSGKQFDDLIMALFKTIGAHKAAKAGVQLLPSCPVASTV